MSDTTAAPGGPYRVVITVGTDHHRFDRLVRWVDDWAARTPDVSVLIQRGTSARPRVAHSVGLMDYDELLGAMAAADVVVAQGGPAGIIDARSVGHRPIVVPRRPEFDEVVDGHQLTFSRWMADRGAVALADTEEELTTLLDQAIADPTTFRIALDHDDVTAAVTAFAAIVDPLLARRAGHRRHRRLAR